MVISRRPRLSDKVLYKLYKFVTYSGGTALGATAQIRNTALCIYNSRAGLAGYSACAIDEYSSLYSACSRTACAYLHAHTLGTTDLDGILIIV